MEGTGDSDWCRSEWPDTATYAHIDKEERGEQTCQTGRGLASWEQVNQYDVDKGLCNVFFKSDITVFKKKWIKC